MTTTTCIFDMDGVLIDSGAHHRSAWRALLDELGVQPAETEYWRLTIGRPAEEAVPLLLGKSMPSSEARRLALRKRDLYAGFAARGHSIRVVRTSIELGVLGTGWLLGGTVGVGTVVYALAIGPLAHVFVPLFAHGRPTPEHALEAV